MPLAPVLMIQGTSSHAGKSTLVAAFCRLFARAGYRVAPFKAQNMSNNAAVTDDGREVGRAQAMQAVAARIPVTVDMNPILLKPQSDRTSQVVVLGVARHKYDAREYYDHTAELWPVVTGALDRLRGEFDVVIAEGAGSPAEINLARYDLVNMRVARYADARVLLVGDIDRGGVFASLFGTAALLPPEDTARIRGFVINKFRGDPSLLDPGFDVLRDRTGIPTLGVIPWLDLAHLPAEDALEWAGNSVSKNHATSIDVAVMRLPRVANLDEFQPLIAEPAVQVRWIARARDLGNPDLIIIPGTKSTMSDLRWLRENGLVDAIRNARMTGTPVLGICGGMQMLGRSISDDSALEGEGTAQGIGLLPIATSFEPEKLTRKVTASVARDCVLWSTADLDAEESLDAYEIHMGRTTVDAGVAARPSFHISHLGEIQSDGVVSDDGLVVGTYLHGLLERPSLRRVMLSRLAARKGVVLPDYGPLATVDKAIDDLADAVRDSIDIVAVEDMIGLSLTARG